MNTRTHERKAAKGLKVLLFVGYGLLCACALAVLAGCRSNYGWWTTEPALPVIPTNTVEVTP